MLRLAKTVRDIKLSKSKKEKYSEIGRKAGISRNYMVKATVKVGGDTYTSGFKSNYAYKDAKRVWWANETSYYDYYPY